MEKKLSIIALCVLLEAALRFGREAHECVSFLQDVLTHETAMLYVAQTGSWEQGKSLMEPAEHPTVYSAELWIRCYIPTRLFSDYLFVSSTRSP